MIGVQPMQHRHAGGPPSFEMGTEGSSVVRLVSSTCLTVDSVQLIDGICVSDRSRGGKSKYEVLDVAQNQVKLTAE